MMYYFLPIAECMSQKKFFKNVKIYMFSPQMLLHMSHQQKNVAEAEL